MALSELVERTVVPYYLNMMATNAVEYGAGLVDEIAGVGRSISDGDVVSLLRSDWRPRVMGAWFAPLHDHPDVRAAVLASLESSGGRLTAPPLAAVASVLCGADAVASLRTYRAADIESQWGAASFVDATLERLGPPPAIESEVSLARDEDRRTLDEMVALVEQLRAP